MFATSFDYLPGEIAYFDSACQSLRPSVVIEAEMKYYKESNACGGRANYPWGIQVDQIVAQTRKLLLDFVGKKEQDYCVVFGPNASYCINLVLNNLNHSNYHGIVTTSKDHNSALLPAMSYAKHYNKELTILDREADGDLNLEGLKLKPSQVFLSQITSNIDGTSLPDLAAKVNLLKRNDHLVLLDATQTLAHHRMSWKNLDFDCLFGSSHKMYGPSLGFMIIKKNLIKSLKQVWVGGGTVSQVDATSYQLIDIDDQLHSRLEIGLLDYAAIFGLHEAISWLSNYQISHEHPGINYQNHTVVENTSSFNSNGPSHQVEYYMESLSELIFEHLTNLHQKGKIQLLNNQTSNILSFLPTNINSSDVTRQLGEDNIMCRSGFMCCHQYLIDKLSLGAIVRISIGLNNTTKDAAKLMLGIEKAIR